MNLKPLTKANSPTVKQWLIGDPSGHQFMSEYENIEKIFKLLNINRKFWILHDINIPVGFIDLEIDDSKGYFSFYIAPDFRGKDFSSELLNLLEKKALELSVTSLLGCVELDNIVSVQSLKKAGYASLENLDKHGLTEFSKNFRK